MILLDFWEELGKGHVLSVPTKHDAWPKTVCWVYYEPECSCGVKLPKQARTVRENRPDIDVRIQADHFKHLVQELLEQKGDIEV